MQATAAARVCEQSAYCTCYMGFVQQLSNVQVLGLVICGTKLSLEVMLMSTVVIEAFHQSIKLKLTLFWV